MILIKDDLFTKILNKQLEFQILLGSKYKSKEYLREQVVAFCDELREISDELEELSGKNYRSVSALKCGMATEYESIQREKKIQKDKVKFELIDAFFFSVNLLLYCPLSEVQQQPLQPQYYSSPNWNDYIVNLLKDITLAARVGGYKSWKTDPIKYDHLSFYVYQVIYRLLDMMEKMGVNSFEEVYEIYIEKLNININRQKTKENNYGS